MEVKTSVDEWKVKESHWNTTGASERGSSNRKQGRRQDWAYLDARLAQGGGHPQVVGVRDLDVAEVVFVGDTPNAEVVYVVHCQVLWQLEFDVLTLVGS